MGNKIMLEQKRKFKLDNVFRSLGKVTLQQRDSHNRDSTLSSSTHYQNK